MHRLTARLVLLLLFLKDHKGKRVLAFDQITAQLVDQVDNGKF